MSKSGRTLPYSTRENGSSEFREKIILTAKSNQRPNQTLQEYPSGTAPLSQIAAPAFCNSLYNRMPRGLCRRMGDGIGEHGWAQTNVAVTEGAGSSYDGGSRRRLRRWQRESPAPSGRVDRGGGTAARPPVGAGAVAATDGAS